MNHFLEEERNISNKISSFVTKVNRINNNIYFKLSHVSLIALDFYNNKEDLFFDYPYNENIWSLNNELNENKTLNNINESVFSEYSKLQNGFISYKYNFYPQDYSIQINEIKTNLFSNNSQKQYFLSNYLKIIDTSVFLRYNRDAKIILGNDDFKCEHYLVTLCRQIKEFKEFSATKNIKNSLVCTFKVKKQSLSIADIKKLYENYFDFIEAYFTSPILPKLYDIYLKNQQKIDKLKMQEQINAKKLELEEQKKKLISSHKHTIKNYQFKGNLQRLMRHITLKNEEVKEIYQSIYNTVMIRDIATDFIYSLLGSQKEQMDTTLIFRENYRTYQKILKLINGATVAYKGKEYLTMDDNEIEKHPCNKIATEDLMYVFSILINLYSNTQKNSDEKNFYISVDSSKNDHLIVTFKNEMPMKNYHINYLNNGVKSEYIKDGSGLAHIYYSLNKVPNIKLSAKLNNNQTEIILLINEKI